MDKTKVQALISLLDDPDETVFNSVEEELLKEDVEVVNDLEKAWEVSHNDVFQRRVENIIHTLQLKDVQSLMTKWINDGGTNLFYGAFLVAKYQYPELDYDALNDKVNELRRDIWLELNNHLTSLEKVRIINHIMFDVHKYNRSSGNFFAPQNSYINEVMNSKKGNPISLSILYSVVAQRLGLPIYGVNLPKNFVLCYLDENMIHKYPKDQRPQVLFYINPVNKGAVLGRNEIEYFVKQQKMRPLYSYFEPCSNIDIIKRVLLNLTYAYQNQGDDSKKKEIELLLDLF
ncbi:Regulator of sirC expression, contains transglutaminase-like and TPR domains [Saccharicrinis carchari]|uniref:Regulator of sirC expression, contains transglutaminase-like and TPR domains n=1 Tax=Saccharicrinis carchari TaxID=1168039 RepID=A0A521ATU7_SACCC|nr:transglutaminase-like domain-containing protein [Saccharicrinis carchari]SMO38234.1 Regulator of sirC expression, contains transglutaminase-like and TPR domains [Saccharicrinis carchari]